MILKRFNVERVEDDPARIRELIADGYEEVKGPNTLDYADMSKPELVVMADAMGIKNAKRMTKAALIEALEAK